LDEIHLVIVLFNEKGPRSNAKTRFLLSKNNGENNHGACISTFIATARTGADANQFSRAQKTDKDSSFGPASLFLARTDARLPQKKQQLAAL